MKLAILAFVVLLVLAGFRELLRAMSQADKPLPNVDWTGW